MRGNNFGFSAVHFGAYGFLGGEGETQYNKKGHHWRKNKINMYTNVYFQNSKVQNLVPNLTNFPSKTCVY